jgi:uncharacterized Zn-finger protein
VSLFPSSTSQAEEVIMNIDPRSIKSDDDEDDDLTTSGDGSKRYECSKCGKEFGRLEFLKRHELRIHSDTSKVLL